MAFPSYKTEEKKGIEPLFFSCYLRILPFYLSDIDPKKGQPMSLLPPSEQRKSL